MFWSRQGAGFRSDSIDNPEVGVGGAAKLGTEWARAEKAFETDLLILSSLRLFKFRGSLIFPPRRNLEGRTFLAPGDINLRSLSRSRSRKAGAGGYKHTWCPSPLTSTPPSAASQPPRFPPLSRREGVLHVDPSHPSSSPLAPSV